MTEVSEYRTEYQVHLKQTGHSSYDKEFKYVWGSVREMHVGGLHVWPWHGQIVAMAQDSSREKSYTV